MNSEVKSDKWLQRALYLSVFTIGYNLVEGGVSTWFGASDETLALFGFGADSFVEVLSGIGILHMVMRMKRSPVTSHDRFERVALRITGIAFYLLTFGLIIGAALSVVSAATPHTTLPGIIISVLSILIMYALYKSKLRAGQELDSPAIVSDARCTLTCFYLSFILLASSLLYHLFKLPYIDALGSLGIAWYAFKEGREAFEKARSGNMTCSDDCC
ncbi:cation transporter [Roseivirga sp. BDSF3-8]|uniref:cation transporter n=1 Tax=Roseivirga sp. BDSF3-8 TaxID=3241598 RepID=UPI00353226F1